MYTLGQMARRNAHLMPDRAALICEGQTTTFAQLLNRSNKLASALWKRGVRKGDRVAILSMNRPEYCDVYGAGEQAGFCINPLNFRLSAPELAWIIGDAQPTVLIFEDQYAATLESLRSALPEGILFVCMGTCPEWVVDYDDLLATGDSAGAPSTVDPEDPLTLMYTSGTTGRPKGALRTNRADFNCGRACAEELGVAPGDLYLVMMPWFHIGARGQQMAAHWRGAAVLMHRRFDPGAVLRDIETYRVTCTHMAPTLIHDCFEHPDIATRDLSSLKTIYYAAAPMPLSLLKRGLARLGPVFCNGYGSTEVTGLCLHKIDHVLDGTAEERVRLQSVGQAQVNTEVAILDDDWNPVPTGEIGEITLKSDGTMERYWNNDAATANAMRDGWFRMGDMGFMDERGFVFLADRKKDMIITGGENVYSREVEEAILLHEGVNEVAIIGVPDLRWGEAVRALVVLRAGHNLTERELIDHAHAQIAAYKTPKSVLFVDELIRLANGKINKVALRERYGQPTPAPVPA